MRNFVEWLIVPLVLLPLLAAGGLLVWAQDAHRQDFAPFREAPAEQVRAWIDAPAKDGLPAPDERLVALLSEREVRGIPVEHPAGAARLVVDEPLLGPEPWRFAEAFPGGLGPTAIADPAVRLQVEAGQAPADLDGADTTALAVRDLLDTPTLPRLRAAPLPVSTKSFLVYRWLERDPANEQGRAAARFLEIVRRFDKALPVGRGVTPFGDMHVVLSKHGYVVYPDYGSLPAPSVIEVPGPDGSPVRLLWAFPGTAMPQEDLLWSGQVAATTAGHYAFQARHGLGWWQAPRVRRWVGPFLVLLLASLFIPVALLLTLRKRRRLDEARVRFLNELAHDLRTPLTSLRLHADLLTGGKAKAERKDGYAARMAVEAARLSSLLGNLLDLTRLERGRRVFDRHEVVLSELAEDARREFVAVFPDRAGDLRLEGDDDVSVVADRPALARVLANLLENAGKFTTPGTPIHLRWSAPERGTRILVEDEGAGIPSTERAHVFERYGRGARAKGDGIPGTGLGLALVRELVEGMGGSVTLRSDHGAAFEIRLGGGDA